MVENPRYSWEFGPNLFFMTAMFCFSVRSTPGLLAIAGVYRSLAAAWPKQQCCLPSAGAALLAPVETLLRSASPRVSCSTLSSSSSKYCLRRLCCRLTVPRSRRIFPLRSNLWSYCRCCLLSWRCSATKSRSQLKSADRLSTTTPGLGCCQQTVLKVTRHQNY